MRGVASTAAGPFSEIAPSTDPLCGPWVAKHSPESRSAIGGRAYVAYGRRGYKPLTLGTAGPNYDE